MFNSQDLTARNSVYTHTWQNFNTQQSHSINQSSYTHTSSAQGDSSVLDKDCIQSLLIAENLFHQSIIDKKRPQELTGLEKSLAAHTSVDNMDENNKFVCTECNKSNVITACVCLLGETLDFR